MTTDHLPPVFQPLAADDPREVGGYRLYARLGAGGMGRVYLSYTPGGRPVALKVVRPEFAEDAEFRRRFAQEVLNAQRIHGLYTAQVIDSGPDAEAPWLVTAYVPGPSLQQVTREHGALPVRTVLLLLGGIAEALQAIHSVQVVHRDLKPANVLVAADGPRVIDFGIARAADATALTGTGFRIGSPAFMAPEQAQGSPVTAATDVFALGALAAYVAGGAPPFGEGPDTAVLYRVVHEEPDLESVPTALRELLLRCLAKRPEDRPSPAEIIDFARNHPAVGGQLRFGEDWLPSEVSTEITRRSDLPRTPPTPLPIAPPLPPATVLATGAGPVVPPPPQQPPSAGHPVGPPPGAFGPVQPTSEVVTGPVLPPTPQPGHDRLHDTPPPGPVVSGPGAPAAPHRRGVSWKTLLTTVAVTALLATVGGVVLVLKFKEDDKDAGARAAGARTPGGDSASSASPSPSPSPTPTPTPTPSAEKSSSPKATTAGTDDASPSAKPSGVTGTKYTPVYTGRELSSPSTSYDFDIKSGKVVANYTTKWWIGHGSEEFQMPSESDAYIAPSGTALTPENCSAAIDREPVKELRYDELPAGRSFCVRARTSMEVAVVRVISVTDKGPVAISMDYYRLA
ncbi:serine/threonine-protein kinase [Kitasatospora sp. NPDC096147]|uniref:serine/threonine-protein kinase n=1 Tax=Kitasatospora sp. NPDC096147 TaxID=3364093 RepID=UPI003810269A